MKHLTYLTFLLASTSVVAAEVTIPNTFVSGTPAVASDVNENFTTMADGINANTGTITSNTDAITDNTTAIANIPTPRSLRVVDGSGVDVGAFISSHFGSLSIYTDEGYIQEDISQATGAYDEGYILKRISQGSGSSIDDNRRKPAYLSPNCAGQEYTEMPNGIVFVNNRKQRVYVPRSGQIVIAKIVSYKTLNNCVSGSWYVDGIPHPLWAAYPNDPAVTGVPNSNYTIPLNIEMK